MAKKTTNRFHCDDCGKDCRNRPWDWVGDKWCTYCGYKSANIDKWDHIPAWSGVWGLKR